MSAWVGNDQEHRLKKASLPTSFLPYHAILTENIYSQLEMIGKLSSACVYRRPLVEEQDGSRRNKITCEPASVRRAGIIESTCRT